METQPSIPAVSQAVARVYSILTLCIIFCLFPFNVALAVNPYEILDKHIDAIGGLDTLRSVKTRYSTGTILYDDLQGTFRTWQEKPLRYRKEVDFSVIKYVEGDSGEQSWLLDTNGRVLIHRDQQTIKRRQIQKLLEEFEHLNPSSPHFSLQYVKRTSVHQRECHVLTLTNTMNSDRLSYYIDTKSFFMVKSIATTPDLKTVSVYDDFRVIEDIAVPFHTVTTYQPIGKTEETRITHYTINGKSHPGAFNIPVSKKDYSFPEGHNSTSVSFELKGNLIYLPVTIGGDTQTWLVDSGSSMSVIDTSYANDLGLLKNGEIRGHGFGRLFKLGFAAIPQYRVADILFEQQKVYTLEHLQENSYEPKIFGILGYDFLSRFVVEIDFDSGTITFHEPKSFTYHGTGHSVDAPLKYRTFTLPVKLGKMSTGLWSVDLGAHQSSLHYPFAKNNQLLSRGGVKTVSQGAAGHSFGRISEFSSMKINDFHLEQQLVVIPDKPESGATAFGEVDGTLGISTLRNFHMYLHYPKQQIILEKGRRFNERFPRDKSGMLIGMSATGMPMVSYIDESGPAYGAGVRVGDILLEMNGVEVDKSSSILGLREVLRGSAGTTIEIKALRDTRQIHADLVLRNLHDGKDSLGYD